MRRLILHWLTLALGVLTTAAAVYNLMCDHSVTERVVVKHPTCTEKGRVQIVCVLCQNVVGEEETEALGHRFSDYVLTVAPSIGTDGEEVGHCVRCGAAHGRAVVCGHEMTLRSLDVAPCCTAEGRELELCALCGSLVAEHELERLPCDYGDWVIEVYAVPGVCGTRTHTCINCGASESESYEMQMRTNGLYIPEADIDGAVTVINGHIYQEDVDAHDLVYGPRYLRSTGPFILGHNYGTLGKLCHVCVGQYIYVSVGGVVETYEVVISEYGLQNSSWTDIVGQTTGTSIFREFDEKTLHIYTCYGGRNGRWIVLATLV